MQCCWPRPEKYIRQLRTDHTEQNDQMQAVKEEIERLNNKITSLQMSLPCSSRASNNVTATTSSHGHDQETMIEQGFERYIRERSRDDWRYWLLGRMFRPLLESYKRVMGEDGSREELAERARDWARQNWQLTKMRPVASSMLVYLATSTSVLTNPSSLRDHIVNEMNKP